MKTVNIVIWSWWDIKILGISFYDQNYLLFNKIHKIHKSHTIYTHRHIHRNKIWTWPFLRMYILHKYVYVMNTPTSITQQSRLLLINQFSLLCSFHLCWQQHSNSSSHGTSIFLEMCNTIIALLLIGFSYAAWIDL